MNKINAVVSKRKIRGQGMTEYIIIVALIAIAAIGVFTAFGGTIRSQVAAMTNELSGTDGTKEIKKAGEHAKEAVDTKNTGAKGLNKFNNAASTVK